MFDNSAKLSFKNNYSYFLDGLMIATNTEVPCYRIRLSARLDRSFKSLTEMVVHAITPSQGGNPQHYVSSTCLDHRAPLCGLFLSGIN